MKDERELIQKLMAEYRLTGAWLINQLAERGVVVDKSSFSSILRGTRIGPKAELVIKTSLEILDEVTKNPWKPSL